MPGTECSREQIRCSPCSQGVTITVCVCVWWERGRRRPLFICCWHTIALQCCVSFCLQWSKSAIGIHMSPFSLTSLTPAPHPTLLGHRRALNWTPWIYSRFPLAIYFTHSSECIQQNRCQLWLLFSWMCARVWEDKVWRCSMILEESNLQKLV